MLTPTTAGQQGLGAALRKLHRSYIRRLQLRLAKRGVSVAQYLHLRALWEEAGLTQNEVSAKLGIEKASSTSVLDSLEREGLIKRARDTEDRRKVRVYMSDKGEALRDDLLPFARQVSLQASRGFTDLELDAFFQAIDRVLANLEAGDIDEHETSATQPAELAER